MKAYVKPELFYERYELSQYIASCAARWMFDKGAEGCTLNVSGAPSYFADTTKTCETTVIDFEAYCYMNGTINGFPTFDS